MKYTKEQLAEMSGENEVKGAPKLDLPILKLNGTKGTFTLLKNGKKSDLGSNVAGIILKIRRAANFYSKTKRMFSTEANGFGDKLVLFETFEKKNGDVSYNKVDEGTYNELKERHPEIKYTQIIYFLLDGEIVKFQVKGGGLTNLFEYYKKFEKDEHLFEFETIVGTEQKTDPITYYATTFAKGGELGSEEMEDVAEKIAYLSETIKKIDEYRKAKPEAQEQPPAESYEGEEYAPEDYEYQE